MKNKILATTYLIMLAVLILGACGVKAEAKTIPLIMCGVSITYFALFFIANCKRMLKW